LSVPRRGDMEILAALESEAKALSPSSSTSMSGSSAALRVSTESWELQYSGLAFWVALTTAAAGAILSLFFDTHGTAMLSKRIPLSRQVGPRLRPMGRGSGIRLPCNHFDQAKGVENRTSTGGRRCGPPVWCGRPEPAGWRVESLPRGGGDRVSVGARDHLLETSTALRASSTSSTVASRISEAFRRRPFTST
jgi:hypothetical protein